jgi:hypothetical protein
MTSIISLGAGGGKSWIKDLAIVAAVAIGAYAIYSYFKGGNGGIPATQAQTQQTQGIIESVTGITTPYKELTLPEQKATVKLQEVETAQPLLKTLEFGAVGFGGTAILDALGILPSKTAITTATGNIVTDLMKETTQQELIEVSQPTETFLQRKARVTEMYGGLTGGSIGGR